MNDSFFKSREGSPRDVTMADAGSDDGSESTIGQARTPTAPESSALASSRLSTAEERAEGISDDAADMFTIDSQQNLRDLLRERLGEKVATEPFLVLTFDKAINRWGTEFILTEGSGTDEWKSPGSYHARVAVMATTSDTANDSRKSPHVVIPMQELQPSLSQRFSQHTASNLDTRAFSTVPDNDNTWIFAYQGGNVVLEKGPRGSATIQFVTSVHAEAADMEAMPYYNKKRRERHQALLDRLKKGGHIA